MGPATKGHEGTLCSDKNVLHLTSIITVVVVTQLHTAVKTHQTIHFKRMNLTVCKLYFNKPDSKNKSKAVKVGKLSRAKLVDSFL